MNRLFKSLLVALLGTLLLTTSLAAAEPLQEGKIRVLVITGGHPFEHEQFYDVFTSIPDIQMDKADYPAAAALLGPAAADKYDVIVFYDMWAQGITPVRQQAFVKLLEKGIGIVALHHTLAAHENWPEYAKIIGGRYYRAEHTENGKTMPASTYLHGQEIRVHVANPNHPITRGLQDYTIHDETYKGYDVDPNVKVLLTTDNPTSGRQLAWVKTYENSRVFYMESGHDHFAYENPNFRTLVARAIRWSAARPADPSAPWQSLFDGKDLSGWQPEGKAVWEVKDGLLIGRQGPGNTPGDLFTKDSFDDFEVAVTYRMVWPGNSGVWYRYQKPQVSLQADILEYKDPFALSGSLYRPGKMFIAINTNPKIIDRDGWNTILIRAAATRQVIFLNGHKTADVHDDLTDHGKIGFQVHPGAQFDAMRIIVRDVRIRPL